jgi:hypothetical protein
MPTGPVKRLLLIRQANHIELKNSNKTAGKPIKISKKTATKICRSTS